MSIDVYSLIQTELDKWELLRAEAVAQYNRATMALEALKELTDSMRAAIEQKEEK